MRRLRRRPAGEGEGDAGSASLTPMVDMLTLMLLFLLKAFSQDAPVRVDEADFDLPTSVSDDPVRAGLVVDVGSQAIHVDGERVVGTVFYERSDVAHVEEVYTRVLRRKGEPISLRVDADVSWRVVRKVLFTLEEAGARDISLVAESRSGL